MYPPGFVLALQTLSPSSSTGSIRAISAVTAFSTSTPFNITLSAFLLNVSSGRRAGQSSCQPGYEWRYALGGIPMCHCPANPECTGETVCNIVPQAQDQWGVLLIPTALCNPQPTTTATPALATNESANITVTPSPSEASPSSLLPLALGLGLGLGVPVLLGTAGVAALIALRRRDRAGKPDLMSPRKVMPELDEAEPLTTSLSEPKALAFESVGSSDAWGAGTVHVSSSLAFPTPEAAALVVENGLVTTSPRLTPGAAQADLTENIHADDILDLDLQVDGWGEEEEPASQQATGAETARSATAVGELALVPVDGRPNLLEGLVEQAQRLVLDAAEACSLCRSEPMTVSAGQPPY